MWAERPFTPLHRPQLGEEEIAAVTRVIRSGWIAQGAETETFESEFAAFVGAPHAVAVSNGTAALALALAALDVGAGGEVVTVSHSFIATANAVAAVGATPVFVDVDPDTLNIDAAKIEAALGPATRAILVVHQLGMPCDLPAILAIAQRHDIPVVEDAACAIGSEVQIGEAWERIGKPHGRLACFSFHARKPLATGEGGMVTADDDALVRRLRLLRNHGMSLDAHIRHASGTVLFESYEGRSLNYRLSDIQAAIGREQLRRIPAAVAERRRLAARYGDAFLDCGFATPLTEPPYARTNYQSYAVRVADGLDQRGVMQRMLDAGIATRRGVMCAHLEPAWPRQAWLCGVHRNGCADAGCLAESERGRDRHLLLPLYPGLSDPDQDRVVAALRLACA
jgi:perosamine synthetase